MTPFEFGVSRSNVKVTMTFKLRGHTCFTNISCSIFALIVISVFIGGFYTYLDKTRLMT